MSIAHTGYRRYTTDQIPVAQVIRRFRNLDMPLDRIQAVLRATDLESRNALIAEHLGDLQVQLAQTQSAVASLRDLLEHPTATGQAADINHRRVERPPPRRSAPSSTWPTRSRGSRARWRAARHPRRAGRRPGGPGRGHLRRRAVHRRTR